MYGKERSNNMIGDIRKFRFWCQKVLPLVYDDSLSYYEVLCKVVQYLNKVIEDVNSIPEYIDAVIDEKLSDEHLQELIEQFVLNIEAAISSNNEGNNTNSSTDYNIGQMLWWNGKLYRVIRQIDAGDTFIVDTNIAEVNFEDLFNDFVDEVKHDITANDDGGSPTATQSWTAGTWVWLNDVLYKVTSDIAQGNAYVFSGVNANVEQITVEGELKSEETARVNADNALQTAIDDEADARKLAIDDEADARRLAIESEASLRANADDALQSAIKTGDEELANKIGNLDELDTTSKNNIVSALNETFNLIHQVSELSVFNVKEYGAKGDNSTDDTEAIQNTIDACEENGGGIVYFPIGKYIVSDTLVINTSYVTLLGASQYGVQLIRSTDYGDTILVSGETQLTAIHIANMFLNHALPTEMIGAHIKMINTAQCSIKNVYTENGYYGFECGGVVDLTIHNCILVGRNSSTAGHNGKYGIFLRGQDDASTPLCTQVKIYGTRIFGPRVAGFEVGICIEGAEEVEVLNCYIGNNKSHNIMFYQRTHIILECTIMGCYLDACTSHSIYFNGNGGDGNLYVGNTKIIGNQLKGQSRDGFTGIFTDDASRGGYFTYCTQGLTIDGNTISGLSSHGIYLLGGNDITIVGNTVSGVGGYCCIIGDGIISATVTGNIFGGASLANGAQDSTHGIAIEDQASEVNCFNNNVVHNTTPMAITADAMGGRGNILANNLGFLNQPAASPAIPASGTELKNPYGTPCFVSVYGGTISNLQINNTTLATGTPVMFELGAQDRVKITYTGAPSWVWFRHY